VYAQKIIKLRVIGVLIIISPSQDFDRKNLKTNVTLESYLI